MVSVITPAILFVVLFALSTDYEVFILSHVREHFLATGDDREAVAVGLERTAAVVTAAGLVLVGTFGSFTAARIVPLKEIGLGLAIGILIDSTVVRLVMVPATMRLLGRANWWMPAWLARFTPELGERAGPEPVPSIPRAGGAP
jgi:RND superfamily putative drug exporter